MWANSVSARDNEAPAWSDSKPSIPGASSVATPLPGAVCVVQAVRLPIIRPTDLPKREWDTSMEAWAPSRIYVPAYS